MEKMPGHSSKDEISEAERKIVAKVVYDKTYPTLHSSNSGNPLIFLQPQSRLVLHRQPRPRQYLKLPRRGHERRSALRSWKLLLDNLFGLLRHVLPVRTSFHAASSTPWAQGPIKCSGAKLGRRHAWNGIREGLEGHCGMQNADRYF